MDRLSDTVDSYTCPDCDGTGCESNKCPVFAYTSRWVIEDGTKVWKQEIDEHWKTCDKIDCRNHCKTCKGERKITWIEFLTLER